MAIEPVRHDLAGVRRFRSALPLSSPPFPSLPPLVDVSPERFGAARLASPHAETGTDRARPRPQNRVRIGIAPPSWNRREPQKRVRPSRRTKARRTQKQVRLERICSRSAIPVPPTDAETGTVCGFFFGDAETGTVICARPRPVSAEPFAAETGTRIGRGNTGLAAQKWVRPSGGRPAASSGRGSVGRRNGYARRCAPSSQPVYVCERPLLI